MLVFVDESGDSGMKQRHGSSALFVIVAVIFFTNDDATACDKKIAELRQECFRNDTTEFKFNKCCCDYRRRFLQAVSEMDFMYFAFVLNKAKLYGEGFKYPGPFYKYTSKLLFENAKPYLQEASVTIDGSGNREFKRQLQAYLKKNINTEEKAIRKVKIEASHKNNLLQLADMVCGSVARSYRRDKDDSHVYRALIARAELKVQVWPKK